MSHRSPEPQKAKLQRPACNRFKTPQKADKRKIDELLLHDLPEPPGSGRTNDSSLSELSKLSVSPPSSRPASGRSNKSSAQIPGNPKYPILPPLNGPGAASNDAKRPSGQNGPQNMLQKNNLAQNDIIYVQPTNHGQITNHGQMSPEKIGQRDNYNNRDLPPIQIQRPRDHYRYQNIENGTNNFSPVKQMQRLPPGVSKKAFIDKMRASIDFDFSDIEDRVCDNDYCSSSSSDDFNNSKSEKSELNRTKKDTNGFNRTKKSQIPESKSCDTFNLTTNTIIDDFFNDSSTYSLDSDDFGDESGDEGGEHFGETTKPPRYHVDYGHFETVEELNNEVKKRVEKLQKIARNHFPATKDNTTMITRLVEQSRACHEFHFLEKRTKYYEAENRGLKIASYDGGGVGAGGARHQIKRLNAIQQRHAKRMMKDLRAADREAKRLRAELERLKPPPNSGRGLFEDDKISQIKSENNFQLAKEKEAVDQLQKEVDEMQKEFEAVERRITLMTQKKSNYSKLSPRSQMKHLQVQNQQPQQKQHQSPQKQNQQPQQHIQQKQQQKQQQQQQQQQKQHNENHSPKKGKKKEEPEIIEVLSI